ncbi:soluble aldose sugar dehydrogenase YliI precursor [Janthinobacterium sp. HH104]|uniref:PQQ-dependent sugar dehydrogenase n=1 Tax=Janthinobacterium sp. HH104 TaxID=1537276 RepID=UPI000874810B|nr:PQQ-dependent sugar dehydrogenase [Janthinobacterium sp. HH104]OEZ77929.1 soluble aldose sugar dehydrogenase YliI precursor [Janthinobacterium sp. HH104]
MRHILSRFPRPWLALLLACCLALLAGCGGGGDDDPAPGPTTGSLTVSIGGLPAGVAGAVTVTGPASYSKTLTASATLTDLAPGAYTLNAASVTQGTGPLAPTPVTQQVQVNAGATASASVLYAAATTLTLGLQEVASGLSVPIFLTAPPGDSRLFILERAGRIRVVQNGTLLATPFLDISTLTTTSGERGLLSMAFHPQYASNGYFFLYYTNLAGDIVIERRQVSAGNANMADPLSALTILTIPHPTFSNHYGGLLSFGPDGYLYAGTGDGGGAGDPPRNAQNTNVLLGKLLRLDVSASSAAQPYAIPPGNPFATAGGRPEIWAYGLRNPWRYAFDLPAQLLYIADVGQANLEEVDVRPVGQAGNNYGWNIMEGTQCYNSTSCNQAGLVLPAIEYGNNAANGCSITGGYVYRGTALPELAGQYLYSDYCSAWLKSFSYSNGTASAVKDWGITNVGNILSFGQNAQNELYMLSGTGKVYKIVRK